VDATLGDVVAKRAQAPVPLLRERRYMDEFLTVLALVLGVPAAVISFWQIIDRLKSFRNKQSFRNKKKVD
jgi:hypothetical protein